MFVVFLKVLLQIIIVLFVTLPYVHSCIWEKIVWAKSQQKIPTDIVICEFADASFRRFRIAVGTHEAVEKCPCIIHGVAAGACACGAYGRRVFWFGTLRRFG